MTNTAQVGRYALHILMEWRTGSLAPELTKRPREKDQKLRDICRIDSSKFFCLTYERRTWGDGYISSRRKAGCPRISWILGNLKVCIWPKVYTTMFFRNSPFCIKVNSGKFRTIKYTTVLGYATLQNGVHMTLNPIIIKGP